MLPLATLVWIMAESVVLPELNGFMASEFPPLYQLNLLVAEASKKEPVDPVVFLYSPGSEPGLRGGCFPESEVIWLARDPDRWVETAIHELIHLYQPDLSEEDVRVLTAAALSLVEA